MNLIQRLTQTKQFHENADVSTKEVVDALEKQQAEIERLKSINCDALGNLNDLCDQKNDEITALKAGFCHATEEAAQQHRKVIVLVNGGEL